MKKLLFIIIISTISSLINAATAPTVAYLDIDINLSDAQNTPGAIIPSSSIRTSRFDSGIGWGYYSTIGVLADGVTPPYNTATSYENSFFDIDDYFSVNIFSSSRCGVEYFPMYSPVTDNFSCNAGYSGGTIAALTWSTSLKIKKKLLGGTYNKQVYLGSFYFCGGINGTCNGNKFKIVDIYLNYKITVNQTCEVVPDNVVYVNFGNLYTADFKQAGQQVGNSQDSLVTFSCTNFNSDIPPLSMRLQTASNSTTDGTSIIPGTRPNIGFQVEAITDGNTTLLRPNNTSSVTPLTFVDYGNNSKRATIKLRSRVVSITGKEPSAGLATGYAFMRIDYL